MLSRGDFREYVIGRQDGGDSRLRGNDGRGAGYDGMGGNDGRGLRDMTGGGKGNVPPRLEEHLHYYKGMRHGLNAAAKSLIYYVIQYDTELTRE